MGDIEVSDAINVIKRLFLPSYYNKQFVALVPWDYSITVHSKYGSGYLENVEHACTSVLGCSQLYVI